MGNFCYSTSRSSNSIVTVLISGFVLFRRFTSPNLSFKMYSICNLRRIVGSSWSHWGQTSTFLQRTPLPQAELHVAAVLAGSQQDCLRRKALLGVTTPNSGPQGVITVLHSVRFNVVKSLQRLMKVEENKLCFCMWKWKGRGGGESLLEMVKIVFWVILLHVF